MASPLAEAHIEGEARLRSAVVAAVISIWESLSGYDRENVDEWLTQVVPVVETGQRASAALTAAFIAQVLGKDTLDLDQEEVIGAVVRNGTPPATVYERPFITLWSGLGAGLDFQAASNKALARATGSAAMDVQLTMRATADVIERAEPGLFGFERVTDPTACEFCREVNGAYVKRASAMPLHNHCGCGLQPLTEPHPLAVELPSGVAVHEHGELGPLLGSPDHDFTSVTDL
jgi:hypothetical protein